MKKHKTSQCHDTKVSLHEEDLKNTMKEIGENFISTASSSPWIQASMLTDS